MLSLLTKRRLGVQDFRGFGVLSFLFYLYLYAPIVVLVVLSFNANQSATVWTGFSLDWYRAAFANQALRQAAGNSLLIAVCASVIATAIATLAALGTSRGAKFKGLRLSMGTIMLPLVLPEIVVGVATLALFSTLGLSLGYGNLIIAHTVFCIPFAYLPIRARLEGLDPRLAEAAADLYASPWKAFWKITLPLLMPGVLSGAMLAFIISMDDFVITYFVAGAGATTLPVYIFSSIRMGISPKINAISSIILMISIAFVALSYYLGQRRR